MGDNVVIDIFKIDDTEFHLKPLSNEQRLGLLPDLLAMLAPLVHDSEIDDSQLSDMLGKGVKSLERLPKLVAAFTKQSKWRRDNETWYPGSWDTCFQRRTLLQLQWCVKCVRLEYGDFLAEGGGLEGLMSKIAES